MLIGGKEALLVLSSMGSALKDHDSADAELL